MAWIYCRTGPMLGFTIRQQQQQPSVGSALQKRAQRATRSRSSFFLPWWAHRKLSKDGMDGIAGVSAAWMPRPSPQGRVYGVPRNSI
ncbi:hypothetical protein ACEN9Z_14065, partial [Stenotrophomonas geniculata]